ncbi:MAG: hypothetical protein ACD_29C00245G0002 [uncultured bacterium]|nr:MAG: hypothetical protein ACD_29C00245G0002 [uncultured bacterium]
MILNQFNQYVELNHSKYATVQILLYSKYEHLHHW